MQRKWRVAGLSLVFAMLWTVGGKRADAQGGPHPAYFHAVSDLRAARKLLQTRFDQPSLAQAATAADAEISSAVKELMKATATEGQNIEADAPVDAGMPPAGRFHKAVELLNSARAHATGQESDGKVIQNRDWGVKHIDSALAILSKVTR